MSKTWHHAELGTLAYDDGRWKYCCDMPGLDVFVWEKERRMPEDAPRLWFENNEGDPPSRDAVAVAKKFLAAQSELASEIQKALWEGFTGTKPDAGTWWHGSLEEVVSNMSGQMLEKPEDLLRVMALANVVIHDKDRYGTPLAEIGFHAAFEEEHGVGVLTDGEAILGIGYSCDVELFGQGGKQPAIHESAGLGYHRRVKTLLESGADKEERYGGSCAIHYAARHGFPEVVKVLLDAGANIAPSSTDFFGLGQPLHVAARYGQTEVMALLLERGADKNAEDGLSGTPLHMAAKFGQVGAVKTLLAAGAATDIEGRCKRPVEIAQENGHSEIVELLVAAGVKPPLAMSPQK